VNAQVLPLPDRTAAMPNEESLPHSVYLDAYLAPFRRWLEKDSVSEILVNRPARCGWKMPPSPGMQRIAAAEVDDRLIQRLAEQVARVSQSGHQPGTSAAGRHPARWRAHPVLRPARNPAPLGHGNPPPSPA